MKLFDLDTLKRDPYQDGLYDLFLPTFNMINGYQQEPYVLGREDEMRIDLVTNQIYDTVEYVDFLCSLNDIDNPLNILEGDVLFYSAVGTIDSFRNRASEVADVRNQLINPNKSTKIDPNRKKYIEENYSLPPTILPSPKPAVRIEGNDIIIGG